MLSDFLNQHGYYFFLGVGAVSMLILNIWRRKQYNISCINATIFTVLLLIVGILGAKLLFFFESGMSSFNGMSFFGSVYLVMIAMPFLGMLFKLTPLQSLDFCAPCVASIIGFMRFGCWCAGCCGGITVSVNNYDYKLPAQLLEGAGDMLILMWLIQMERKKASNGRLYPLLLISYGVLRFAVEFIRDTAKDWLYLSHGQWFSIIGIILSILILGVQNENKKKT